MFQGNPNRSATPYAPYSYYQSPTQPGYRNPYGFGEQRTAGQLAVQPNVSGTPTNSVPQVWGATGSRPYQMNPNRVSLTDRYGNRPHQGMYLRQRDPNNRGAFLPRPGVGNGTKWGGRFGWNNREPIGY